MDDFDRFAVVENVSDHHFIASGKSSIPAGSKAYKKIMREWKLLQEGLPDSIFVRTYETRIDLLRAVIIGANDTPYHDGLFLFDIAFPAQYPATPPKVQFRSYGLRINPNLYNSGFVCLSLLNTYFGSHKERWNSSESTILQILLSIQALILNEKPYYNEPMTGHYNWTKKRSLAYNEDVFLMSCKIMIFTMRNPPKNFEALVAGHFRRRAAAVLAAVEAYANGRVLVGYFRDETKDSPSGVVKVSKEFRRNMAALYPVLASRFVKNGASIQEASIRELELVNEISPSRTVENDGKKGGVFQKMMKKIRKVLGFKKKNDQKKTGAVS